jgi:ATP:ADP antiporter, AAA family
MDQVRRFLTRVFDIREGEFVRTFLMFSYLLIIIACYVTTKSVRDSLFLKRIGFNQLPYVYMVIAIVVGFISSFYSKAARRVSVNQLIRLTSLIAVFIFFVFWLLLRYNWPWMFYVLYIWVSIFIVVSTSQFWLLANYVFNPREAKRLFALIGSGGVLGGFLGGYFTKFGAFWFGTEGLMLWCIGFIGISILLLERTTKEAYLLSDINPREKAGPESESSRSETRRLLKIILNSRHLTLLTAILGITVILESFIDYQFKYFSDQSFGSQDQLTSFFGTLTAYGGVLSLIIQVFLTSRILKRFGVGVSILFLPISLFIGSLFLVFRPSLWAVAFLKISDLSFSNSIHRSGVELLYLPIPIRIKNQVKGFIDMFIDRLGRGVGGILLFLFSSVITLSIAQLSLFGCGLVFVWIILSIVIKREYLNSFRLALEKKTIEPEMLRVRISDSATLETLLRVLQSPDERQVLYAMELLTDANLDDWVPQLRLLVRHQSSKVRALAIENLTSLKDFDMMEAVTECLGDSDLSVRAEAIHFLCVDKNLNPSPRLREFLHHENYAIVVAAIHCMAKYQWHSDELISRDFIEHALKEEGERREVARVTAACALGLVNSSSQLQGYLPALLQDPSTEVVRNAVRSAGQILSWEAFPILIGKLADPTLRSDARETLLRYGPKIIGTLSNRLNDPNEPIAVRANIPKLLALTGRPEAADALIQSIHQPEQFLEYRVIKALNSMRINYQDLALDGQTINSLVIEELKDYYRLGLILHSMASEGHSGKAALPTAGSGGGTRTSGAQTVRHDVLQLLNKALQERMDQKLERAFRLLGLRYPPRDIYSAYSVIRSTKSHLRASAIEFLDNLLHPDLKSLLFPILEEAKTENFIRKGSQLLHLEIRSRSAYLEQLIRGRDPWLKAIAIYVAGSLGQIDLASAIRESLETQNLFVRETAQWSWGLLKNPQMVKG